MPLAKPKLVGHFTSYEGTYQLYFAKFRISAAAAEMTGCEYVVSVSGKPVDSDTFDVETADGGHGWWTACSRETAYHLVHLAGSDRFRLAAHSELAKKAA